MRDEHPEVLCANCGEPMNRLFQPLRVHYHGDGFYTTDHVLSDPTEDEVLASEVY
jgi:predicted nucleic acid-binding Zn ribbon protein